MFFLALQDKKISNNFNFNYWQIMIQLFQLFCRCNIVIKALEMIKVAFTLNFDL